MSTAQSLKESGLKATLPRRKILELFEASKVRHLSAEDVYRALLAEGIDIGLATVYRVLTQFEQAGLLARQHFETGKAVFELNQGGHHDHLLCLQCGRVEEFYDSEIEKRQTDVARQRGFQLHGHSLALYADCIKQDCPYRPAYRRPEAPRRACAPWFPIPLACAPVPRSAPRDLEVKPVRSLSPWKLISRPATADRRWRRPAAG